MKRWTFLTLGVLVLLLMPAALGMIFFYAPLERTMGVIQKIFYFHVGYAAMMMFGFGICGIASLVYLSLPRAKADVRMYADAIAVGAAEVGLVGGAGVMIMGPLWAHEAWGTYWTWEPRLTLSLVAFFMFLAYMALRSFSGKGDYARVVSAGLAVLGLPALYFIHVAVSKWGGAHPRVVFTGGLKSGGMKETFFMALGTMLLTGVLLGWLRAWVEVQQVRMSNLIMRVDALRREVTDE